VAGPAGQMAAGAAGLPQSPHVLRWGCVELAQ